MGFALLIYQQVEYQVLFMNLLMKRDTQCIIHDKTIEPLTSDQFVLSDDGQSVTINGLTASQSNIVVSTTLKKRIFKE